MHRFPNNVYVMLNVILGNVNWGNCKRPPQRYQTLRIDCSGRNLTQMPYFYSSNKYQFINCNW